MDRLALILVPAGLRRDIVKLIKQKKKSVEIFDIESQLCKELNVDNIFQAINNHSRSKLKQGWQKVINDITGAISLKEKGSKLYLLVGHSVYYKSYTREFFSIFDTSLLRQLASESKLPKITHVILIIDDVFDIYTELSEERELYGKEPFSEFVYDYARTMGQASLTSRTNSKIYISWLHYCMNSILNWRSQEIILAQNIAEQLGSKFMLWGLKQDLDILFNWLSSADNKIFYISHPISEPRSIFKQKSRWPAFVRIINSLQENMKKYGMCVVMPTAIDEYRFEKRRENYTSRLTSRWPIPNHVAKILSQYSLTSSDSDKHTFFSPHEIETDNSGNVKIKRKRAGLGTIQEYINSSLNTLEMTILEQVANRDHSLVWLTDGIIVIEPWSVTKKQIHSGILKELLYLGNVNHTIGPTQQRRICAVFSKSSVRQIVRYEKFKPEYIDKLRILISRKYSLARPVVDTVINENGGVNIKAGSLGASVQAHIISDIKGNLTEYKSKAILVQFLAMTMAIGEEEADFTMILIVDKPRNLLNRSIIKKANEFLTEGIRDDLQKKTLLDMATDAEII